MTHKERQAYELGEQAAMRGLSRDDCPYRLHDLRACWLRGWHAWHAAVQPDDPVAPVLGTPDCLSGQKTPAKATAVATPAAREGLARLKAMLR